MIATKIRRKRRKYSIGDLRDAIKIQTRAMQAPEFGQSDYDLDFSDVPDTWASIETKTGKTVFDGVGLDLEITHVIGIRYDVDVTAEASIELDDGERLDIKKVDNLEKRNEWMELLCTSRGFAEASKV